MLLEAPQAYTSISHTANFIILLDLNKEGFVQSGLYEDITQDIRNY